jgi:pimeloyl-ACP methyl ester carboxylesterase
MRVSRRVFLGVAATAGLGGGAARAQDNIVTLTREHPDGRQTSYRMMLPSAGGDWPVILFSHGANSSNLDYDRLWRAWALAGYLVIGPNHIDTGPRETQKKVGSGELWVSRLADTALPLNQKGAFEALALAGGGRPDWGAIAVAGHSFGAVVAQALAGATLFNPEDHKPVAALAPGVKACLTFSPPGPLPGFIPPDAWSTVTAPSLLQTGTADVLQGFVNDWHLRLTGFSGPPDRWTIVAKDVDHYFGGLICRRKPAPPADVLAMEEVAGLSCDVLDAYVRGRAARLKDLKLRASFGNDGVLTFAEV